MTSAPRRAPPRRWSSASRTTAQALLTGMEWVDPAAAANPGQRHAQRRGRHQHHQPGRAVAADRDLEPEAGRRRDGRAVHVRRADLGPVRPAHRARPLKKGNYAIEEPATVRVLEAPTSDTYRSILGEWGYGSPLGPRELERAARLSRSPPTSTTTTTRPRPPGR